MAEGRYSAVVVMVVLSLQMVLHCQVDSTGTMPVGGRNGWNKDIAGWGKGMKFFVGESLEFNYPKGQHNVVVVKKAGYDACKAAPGDKVYTSGKDVIPLAFGDNYFICTIPGHCASMKLHVNALKLN